MAAYFFSWSRLISGENLASNTNRVKISISEIRRTKNITHFEPQMQMDPAGHTTRRCTITCKTWVHTVFNTLISCCRIIIYDVFQVDKGILLPRCIEIKKKYMYIRDYSEKNPPISGLRRTWTIIQDGVQ